MSSFTKHMDQHPWHGPPLLLLASINEVLSTGLRLCLKTYNCCRLKLQTMVTMKKAFVQLSHIPDKARLASMSIPALQLYSSACPHSVQLCACSETQKPGKGNSPNLPIQLRVLTENKARAHHGGWASAAIQHFAHSAQWGRLPMHRGYWNSASMIMLQSQHVHGGKRTGTALRSNHSIHCDEHGAA